LPRVVDLAERRLRQQQPQQGPPTKQVGANAGNLQARQELNRHPSRVDRLGVATQLMQDGRSSHLAQATDEAPVAPMPLASCSSAATG